MATKRIEDGIRNYLDSLGQSDKPVVDREAVKALREQIRAESDVINKAKLMTQLEQEEQGRAPDFSGEQAVFVAEAKAWADEAEVSATTLQTLGVPDEVLQQAGFETPAPGTRAGGSGRSRRSGGTRAPRIPIEEVAAAARKLGSGWKLTQLASALDRDQATARNYVNKLVEDGVVTVVEDDPKHDGRGRAAKIYGVG